MDRPLPDPAKLLEAWMEWERGDVPPGRVMATLKTGGLRDLLEALAEAASAASASASPSVAHGDQADTPATEIETWTPVV